MPYIAPKLMSTMFPSWIRIKLIQASEISDQDDRRKGINDIRDGECVKAGLCRPKNDFNPALHLSFAPIVEHNMPTLRAERIAGVQAAQEWVAANIKDYS
jgi:hypothetical protein